jgi:ATP-dependent 26S proteasome regulatory subunit
MGNARPNTTKEKIQEEIKNITSQCLKLGTSYINVALDYQNFNPNFCPKPVPQPQNSMTRTSEDSKKNDRNSSEEFNYEKLSQGYQSITPRYSFDQVVLSDETRESIEEAISILEVESKVFDEWGLRSIIPNASSALSFYGEPGTGKTMAAEAVAHKLGKRILSATYADIESKFHGEGPKMVKAIFRAAERDNAILFLDESDSLLSKRLTNVSDGSAQAINSMRSQLLISLEQFEGIVIFATNLVVNYDKAFLSRLISVEFTKPNKQMREKIWLNHLHSPSISIPLGDDVDLSELSEIFDFCGREIRNSVKSACVAVALAKRDIVLQADLIKACERVKAQSEKVVLAKDHTNIQPGKGNDVLKEAVQKKLDERKDLDHP